MRGRARRAGHIGQDFSRVSVTIQVGFAVADALPTQCLDSADTTVDTAACRPLVRKLMTLTRRGVWGKAVAEKQVGPAAGNETDAAGIQSTTDKVTTNDIEVGILGALVDSVVEGGGRGDRGLIHETHGEVFRPRAKSLAQKAQENFLPLTEFVVYGSIIMLRGAKVVIVRMHRRVWSGMIGADASPKGESRRLGCGHCGVILAMRRLVRIGRVLDAKAVRKNDAIDGGYLGGGGTETHLSMSSQVGSQGWDEGGLAVGGTVRDKVVEDGGGGAWCGEVHGV